MAARSGHPAGPCRSDRRLGRRRPCRDGDPARSPAGLAVSGRDDAAVPLARHGSNRRAPLAKPLSADLAGLPPMYIQTGADETLLDDSRKLAELARKSGVDVTLEVVPEMPHVFQFLAGTAPEADAAIRRLADWVRPKLGLG